MPNFKNMEELMNHLVSGGAITNLDDSCKECWLSLYEGELRFPNVIRPFDQGIGEAQDWRPVPMKWLTDSIHKNTKKVEIVE